MTIQSFFNNETIAKNVRCGLGCLLILYLPVLQFSALGIGEEKTFANPPTQLKPTNNNSPGECSCPEDEDEDLPPQKPKENTETLEQIINFENEIQNIVYVKWVERFFQIEVE